MDIDRNQDGSLGIVNTYQMLQCAGQQLLPGIQRFTETPMKIAEHTVVNLE